VELTASVKITAVLIPSKFQISPSKITAVLIPSKFQISPSRAI